MGKSSRATFKMELAGAPCAITVSTSAGTLWNLFLASQHPDRIEREGDEFVARVDSAYRELAGIFAQRIVTVDATQPPQEVAELIRGHIRDLS